MRRSISPDIDAVIRSLNMSYDCSLSIHASRNEDAIRRKPDGVDIRPPYFRDSDRIVHSLAYTRYIDKTQVFYLVKNDHITHRVLHVQLVSKIARLIGRGLRLNEDLIEAISLGHDIGHVPYGHDGEQYLSNACKKYGLPGFFHNIQSYRSLEKIESLNLTLQVLDGIVAHNGEAHDTVIKPQYGKTWDAFEADIQGRMKNTNGHSGILPMTLEGAVVRVSDTISYIGRDIEDAITLGLLSRDEIPDRCSEVLGNNNRDIVNNLVIDVIENSYNMDYIALSPDTAAALRELKEFNMKRIYMNPSIKTQSTKVEKMFGMLFDTFMDDLRHERKDSRVYSGFVDRLRPDIKKAYLEETSDAGIVADFIAGMTDQYFNDTFKDIFLPGKTMRY